jgi:HPt (histidine-containing phosphotransfer) domain-containing protein/hemerythrin
MEIGEVFRDELKEEFARLELIVLSLEKGENQGASMDHAKRILHNMKGSARVAGFEACGRVIHYMESLLIEKPLSQILEVLLAGMDLSLCLVEPDADESEAERFISKPLQASVPGPDKVSASPQPRAPACEATRRENPIKKATLLLPESLRILVCGDRNHLKAYQGMLNDQRILLQWHATIHNIALLLQEQIFDAVVLDFSCLSLAQGCVIRKIRRVSESMPIMILAETVAPCLMLQVSRLENVSCFPLPLVCAQGFIRHLQKRIVMAKQSAMFSRALRTIWYLDPQQDPRMEQDARTLMHYQDALRGAGLSHQDWDFENHSQKDKQIVLSDVHDEIALVLHDLMDRIDQKALPLSLIRLRHRHLLDCIDQHFLEENAMMRAPDHHKKFLDQHIRHHDEAMVEFRGHGIVKNLDDIRFFCDQVTQFIRQHASFDETLEEYLLRDPA